MKLLFYYFLILAPLPFLCLLVKVFDNSFYWLAGMCCYVCIYKPFVDGNKLLRLGAIHKNEFWKMFNLFGSFRLNFTHELYFENK